MVKYILRMSLAILMIVFTTACSPIGFLGGLVSDTPSIEAQVGKTNEKTVGIKAEEIALNKETRTAEHIVEDSKIGTITGGTITIDESIPWYYWVLLVMGWMLPSPGEIYRGLGNLFINIKKFIKD